MSNGFSKSQMAIIMQLNEIIKVNENKLGR